MKTYYDDYENMAEIQEHEIFPYKGSTRKEKAYRLVLYSIYDNDFIYHVSVHETEQEAINKMMSLSCGTWKLA